MDAAERLFATHGFEATSLRVITGEAGVNLGAVNYHFATKDDLIVAVLMRRMGPINEKRLALLGGFETAAGNKPAPVEQILEAMFRPVLELLTCSSCEGGRSFLRLLGQVLAEPGIYLVPLIKEQFAEKMARFTAALGRALPGLSEQEIYWKFHFATGAFVHTVARSQILELTSHGKCRLSDVDDTLARIIPFCAAGFQAAGKTNAIRARRTPVRFRKSTQSILK